MLMFLNEKSCTSTEDQEVARQAMLDFVQTCRAVRNVYRSVGLVTEAPLSSLEIAPGYYFAQWRNEARNRDAARFLQQTLIGKSPVNSVLDRALEEESVEYTHDGLLVRGLAAADLTDSLAVSLPTAPAWDSAWVQADYVRVEDGQDELSAGVAEIRHASDNKHVETHRDWIRATGAASAKTGAQIWAEREVLFPHLQFTAAVERNLGDLEPVAIPSVLSRLLWLEDILAAWTPGEAEPAWGDDVVPEHETRVNKGLCNFVDSDGVKRLFSLHCRFKPNPGRIHLRLITELSAARIGYIGRKRLEDGVPRSSR